MTARAKNALGRRSRRVNYVEPLEYYLIVCEGEKTEPGYFMEIRNLINARYENRVEVKEIEIDIQGEGTNTIFLLKRAQKMVEELRGQVTQVWLVYDKDDFPHERFDGTSTDAKRISEGGDVQYNVAWSNQCIEYWFLLHFENLQSNISRTQYCDKLDGYFKKYGIGRYQKNRRDIFSKLCYHGDIQLAIRYAKKRLKENEGNAPSRSTPATRVHELIENLLAYLPDFR